MLLYSKTYENIKTKNSNFPIEDSYYSEDSMAVVADGITRDSVEDLSILNFEEMIKQYPRPSGAEIASKTICNQFQKMSGEKLTLTAMLISANEKVKHVNDIYIETVDYLVNDYYGAVASAIRIRNELLEYAYICDCGIIVFDKNGNIKFQTDDDMSRVDKYFDAKGYPWHNPNARLIVRRDYRNKPENKYSYGAITGEKEAEHYIRNGIVKISKGDYVIVYSDGFINYFNRGDFFSNIKTFDSNTFDDYVEAVAETDYEKYGKEKTVVLYEI